jgi:hypothetical protein
MRCAEVSDTIDLWSARPDFWLSEGRARELREHLDGCAECRARFSVPVGFLLRDSRIDLPEMELAASEPDDAFVSRTMRAIRYESRYRDRRAERSSSWRHVLAAALFSALVFCAGFYLRGIVGPSEYSMVQVHFTFNAQSAKSVQLIGFYPDGGEDGITDMKKNKQGVWSASLELKRDSVFIYTFLVDGTMWVPDPSAEEIVDDGFGGTNSLLRL